MSREDQDPVANQLVSDYQEVLDIVSDAEQPINTTELAERMVKRGETVMSETTVAERVERTVISLHHNVLPRLDDYGVITYHPDANTAASRNDRQVEIDWLDGDSIAKALSNLQRDRPTDNDSIGVIHGRQTVIEYGRALADEAEEELFCMYHSTDLLEDECLAHAEDAIDRGVEMYMGSRNPEVRDLTRRHLPAATIWEPQRGWLNAPIGSPKVGRLVLVDRRKVMLAILDDSGPDAEHPEESAIVGAGAENPLIVLVRELLGPRLDHLDYQSTDFHSELHT